MEARSGMDLTKVRAALTGVEEDQAPESTSRQYSLLSHLVTPPSYFVYLLLRLVGFRSYQMDDKSEWQFYVRYRGASFCILDWKTMAWSIEGIATSSQQRGSEEILGKAESLRRRIETAGRHLDKVLEPELKKQVMAKDFALQNSYDHVRSLYDYFRGQVEDALHALEEVNVKETTSSEEFLEKFNQQLELERIASYNACAMIAFFFSYTDLIFDTLFALFLHSTMSFQEFRALSWRERFLLVLPVAQERHLSQMYQQLLRTKQTWRDIPLHGFGGHAALLVPVPGLGLIPTTFESISTTVHFSHTPIREENARQVLELLSSFDTWLAENERTQYAVLYAQSGLEIPFSQERIEAIRSWMASPEAFKNALNDEKSYRQYLLDQYQ
jgi:hypothetical protein